MSRIILAIVFAFILGFSGITYIALESEGVVEIKTWNSEAQTQRATHVWYVRSENGILLEGGSPNNPWVLDLADNETIQIRGSEIDGEYRFKLIADRRGHEEIRKRMREKYGWRDRWVSWIFNVEDSLMIQVFPI